MRIPILNGNCTALNMCALILLIAASAPALAQQRAKIQKIEIVGLKRLTPDQVIAISGLQTGQAIDPNVLDAASEKLMQSGLFRRLSYRVRSADDQATVIFDVEEAARNLPVVFENFVWFTDDEIVAAIRRDVPFFDGTAPQTGATADKIAAALQRLLTTKKIPGQVEFLPYVSKDRQELLFTVKGAKIPVCSLHFPGATAISEADLIKASQPLLKTDYSRKDVSGFATYTLFPLYRHLGRLRAQFQSPAAAPENSAQCAGGVAVTIPVDEGAVYSWRGAEWNGNQKLTTDELAAALGMKAGGIADGVKIDKGLKEVHKAYGHRGYIAAQVKESSEFDDASSGVGYRFTISEGPRYFMGNLIVTGLAAADADALKSKWTLGANAVFDDSYIDTFRQTALREFLNGMLQRSRSGTRAKVEFEARPDAQKLTVDVLINFK